MLCTAWFVANPHSRSTDHRRTIDNLVVGGGEEGEEWIERHHDGDEQDEEAHARDERHVLAPG